MSHVASVQCYVTDLKALEKVCKDMGLELVRGATSYRWYGTWVNDFRGGVAAVTNGHDPKTFGQCLHKIRRPDDPSAYEIGLVRRLDGKPGYELLFDNWGTGGRSIQAKAGTNLGLLKDRLTVEVTKRTLLSEGYRISTSVDAQGATIITATK